MSYSSFSFFFDDFFFDFFNFFFDKDLFFFFKFEFLEFNFFKFNFFDFFDFLHFFFDFFSTTFIYSLFTINVTVFLLLLVLLLLLLLLHCRVLCGFNERTDLLFLIRLFKKNYLASIKLCSNNIYFYFLQASHDLFLFLDIILAIDSTVAVVQWSGPQIYYWKSCLGLEIIQQNISLKFNKSLIIMNNKHTLFSLCLDLWTFCYMATVAVMN